MRMIDLLIKADDRTQSEIAVAAGLKPKELSDKLKGKTNRLTSEDVAAISQVLKVDATVLMNSVSRKHLLEMAGGKDKPSEDAIGKPPKVSEPTPPARHLYSLPVPESISFDDLVDEDLVTVPVVGRVAAGTPVTAEENIEEMIQLPRALVKRLGVAYCLRIYGDSMEAVPLVEGDIVLVGFDEHPALNQIVVATSPQTGTTCKGYVGIDVGREGFGEGEAWLRAYPLRNPHRYPDIPVDENVSFQGVVQRRIQGKPQIPRPVAAPPAPEPPPKAKPKKSKK